jgi:hypothetical protein
MSTTTLSTTVTQTLTLNSTPNLSITSTGGVIIPGQPSYSKAVYALVASTVTNAGVIVDFGDGIELKNGGVVVNSGTITATRFSGVFDVAAAATVTNTGTITGTQWGVALEDGGAVTNSGTIGGISYGSVLDQAGNFNLTVDPGAVFEGTVHDIPGTGHLTLAGTTAGSLNISTFQGFNAISFATGADWTLAGGMSQLATGQTISGFGLHDELVLQGNTATSASYIAGTGVVLNTGATLGITGPTSLSFYATTDGTNTTIQGLIATISTDITTDVSLNNGTYAPKISITNTGTVNAAGNAIYSLAESTVTNAGTVIGSVGGINLRDGGVVINTSASANIQGGQFDGAAVDGAPGVVINAGTMNGSYFGAALLDGGTIINSGTLSGGHGALYDIGGNFTLAVLPGAVFTGEAKDASGGGNLVLEGSTASSLNIGNFQGFSSISFAHGSDWTLAGTSAQLEGGTTISGFTFGDELVLQNAVATAATYHPGAGVSLSNGAIIDVNRPAGSVFYASTDGTNTTLQALIATISTSISGGIDLNNGTYAPNMSVTSAGIIIGSTVASGISAASIATVTNAGTVAGEAGIYLTDGGTVNNTGSGLLDGTRFDGIQSSSAASVIVLNAGTILGTGANFSYGIFLGDGGAVTNSGTIGGVAGAIRNESGNFTLTVEPTAVFNGSVNDLLGGGDLILAGTTATSLNIGSFTGFSEVSFASGSEWTLSGSGSQFASGETISGFKLGDKLILDSEVASATTFNAGTGLTLSNGQVVNVNSVAGAAFYATVGGGNTTIQALIATISSTVNQSVFLNNGTYAPNLSLTTAGTINGLYGISAGSYTTVTNSGTIDGHIGMYLKHGGFITNTGTQSVIKASVTEGIDAQGAATTVVNAGTIIAQAFGIFTADGGAVTNSGTIGGVNDAAIDSHTGNFTVTALPGAVFNGAVVDEAGTGDLILGGTAASSLNIASFTGFSAISFATGADWTLAGTNAQLDTGETIAGFTIGDEMVLAGNAATYGSFVAGTGLELSNGKIINVNSVAGDVFLVTNNGTNTTIKLGHELISTISTSVTMEVDLGNGTYAPTMSVTTAGKISGGVDGISASSATTITNAGTIAGSVYGIALFNGGTVTNSGTIGGGNAAIDNQGGNFTLTALPGAAFIGAVDDNGANGDLLLGGSVNSSMSISSLLGFTSIGFEPGAHWTLGANDAALAGGETITGFAAGDAMVLAGSAATSGTFVAGVGLELSNGQIVNVNSVAGAEFYVTSNGSSTTIQALIATISTDVNSEVVLGNGTYTPNISVTSTGTVASTGTVFSSGNSPGNSNGVFAFDPATVTNAGTVTATGYDGAGVYLKNGGVVTNSGTQSFIRGGYTGIGDYDAAATVSNAGTIIGGQSGVRVSGGTISNNGPNSFIQGGQYDGVYSYNAPATVTNAGTILGGFRGAYFADGGSLTNSGTIGITGSTFTGVTAAVYNYSGSFALTVDPGAVFEGAVIDHATIGGDLVLAGSTAGTLDISSFSGFTSISFAPGSDWTLGGTTADLSSGQTIAGFAPGDEIVLAGSAATSGTYVAGTGLVLSNGQTLNIPRPAGDHFVVTTGGTGTTIQLSSSVVSTISTSVGREVQLNRSAYYAPALSVTSTGTVNGGANAGVYAYAGDSLTNAGTVEGGSYGVDLIGGAAVTNSGLIQGGVYYGVFADNTAPATIINTGTITGTKTGVFLQDGGAVTNAGTFSGANGTDAFYSEAGSLALTVDPGADFIGDVVDHAGNGDLILGGSVASTLNLNTFFGFTSLAIAPGANWTLGGADSELTSGQTITGFDPGDEIVLAGSAATSGTFVAGVGLVLNNGQTLNVNAPPADAAFYITSNGTSTTVQELIGTISAPNGGVTLGNGTYTPNISVTTAGTVNGGSTGILAPAAATVTNAGTVAGVTGVTLDDGGDINNTGTQSYIDGTGGFGLDLLNAPATVVNAGTITGIPDGVYLQDGGVVTNSGTITGMPDAIYNKAGSFTLNVMPGAVFGGESVDQAGNGTLNLGGTTASTLNLNTFIGFNPLNFGTGAAWTVDTSPTRIAGETIGGFEHSDTIDISPLSITSGSLLTLGANGELAIGTLDVDFAGLAAGKEFTLVSDGHGGENLELVACFCPGTRISTPDGYTLVENLAIGDLVTTASAGAQRIKWIGRRSYAAPFCNNSRTLPIRIAKGALGKNLPSRALHLSPGHALAIDGQLVHAGRLVNGASITQKASAKLVEYFHIELETHEVIFAENLPVESFMDEDFRAQFENAASYAALYPGARAPRTACLPALRDGFELFALQRRLAHRAGATIPLHTTGPLQGCVDDSGPVLVRGWAQDVLAPEHPVSLIIMAGGVYAGQVLANAYRPDLLKAGLGSGHHGFEYVLPAGVTGSITLHRTADGTQLAAAIPQTKAA